MASGANAESSLRDDLAAGLKDIEERQALETPAAPEGEQAEAPQAEPDAEASETQSDRGDGRDAHGRFVPKPKEGEAAEPEAGSTAKAAPKTEDQQETEQPDAEQSQTVADTAPKSWRADEAKAWATVPPEAKAAILRREAEAARLAGANDSERMFGREMADIFRPHIAEIQQTGASPQLALKALLANHNDLRSNDPNVKLGTARRLLAQYGVDVQQLAQPDPNAPSDPFVVQLQNEIAQLKARLGPQGQPQQQQEYAPLPPSVEEHNIMTEIEAFRADPAHPHFDAVHQVMGKLLETGAAPDLESAYHAAVAMTPALRSTATPPVPAANPAQKTAAARRAAASVTGSPGQTGNPAPMSLRDELMENGRKVGLI
jgi:hypothetical protein